MLKIQIIKIIRFIFALSNYNNMNYENLNYKGNDIIVGYYNCTIDNFEIKEIFYKEVDVYELLEFDIDYINELLVEQLFY